MVRGAVVGAQRAAPHSSYGGSGALQGRGWCRKGSLVRRDCVVRCAPREHVALPL